MMGKILNKIFHKKVITRFAPSPTGMLHIGALRTALYSYVFAKQNKGKFYLRIEDTDKSRYVEGSIANIIDTLDALGLKPDNELYFQSKHINVYNDYAKQLVKKAKAYHCFCSSERLARVRKERIANKQPPGYDGQCRGLSKKQIDNYLKLDKPYVIRMKIPKQQIVEFNDVVRGQVKISSENIDDQVLIKSDGYPTYHLAVVVDDHQMGVTHVIRGEEWLPSTPKHILLYKAFGWQIPVYVHMPLLLNADRSKLSKRSGDVSAKEYLDKGYLPAAIINFMALLGWNPGIDKELYSIKELIKEFSLEKINKAGAVFNIAKLNWFNQIYYQKLSERDFYKQSKDWLNKFHPHFIKKYNLEVAKAAQSRINNFAELTVLFEHVFKGIKYRPDILIFKKSTRPLTLRALQRVKIALNNVTDINWNSDNLELQLLNVVKNYNLTNGDVFWPVRVALSGKQKSESPTELLLELGKDRSLKRIQLAINSLKKP